MLVSWSGGLDSTLVVENLLKSENHLKKGNVRLITVIHPQLPSNPESSEARLKILNYWKEKYYEIPYIEVKTEIKRPIENMIHNIESGGLIHPLLWISYIYPYLNNNEDLYFGYIRGDDFWHHLQEFNEIFEGMKKLVPRGTSKLMFPLEWHNKEEVINAIPSELGEMCWWCELPFEGKCCLNVKDRKIGSYCDPCTKYYMYSYLKEQKYATKSKEETFISSLSNELTPIVKEVIKIGSTKKLKTLKKKVMSR